jgi:hypothetical protein
VVDLRPPIALIGCPEKDVGAIESRLAKAALNLRPKGTLEKGDHVLFCISASHGPTEGTRTSLESLQGKSIIPIAIVLTYADVVTDDSLRELINCEERALLATVLPENVVDDLPLLLDLDPNLVHKISDLTKSALSEVRCAHAS